MHGVPRALVIFGGEIVAGDRPPREEGWPISIEGMAEPLIIANRAVSTSGDAEQFADVGGVRYSHVIDPLTGWALTSRVSATVEAPSGMIADALATSATVLDSAAAEALVRHYPGSRLVLRSSRANAPAQPQANDCRKADKT
jgi:thiamine biosynthesis lipoprotein